MKRKKLLSTILIATAISFTTFPTLPAKAASRPEYLNYLGTYAVSPRYKYLERIYVSVVPGSSEVVCNLKLNGTGLESFSGTMTLYKESSPNSGSYTKVKSLTLSLTASNEKISHKSSVKSEGSGKYKLTYSGTAYTSNGNEYFSMSSYGSY